MKDATLRLAGLRNSVSTPPTADSVLTAALQELDTAHEELRQTEAYLHSQADELAVTMEALDRGRRFSRDLFELAPVSYLLTDMRGQVSLANRRTAELLAVDAKLLQGKPLVSFVDPEDRRRFFELLARPQRTGAAVRGELRMRPRRNPSVSCLVSISCIASATSEPAGLRWLLWDDPVSVSDGALLRETHRVLGQVASELRTHLSSASGWLQIPQQHAATNDAVQGAMASVTRALRTLTRLVDGLHSHEPSPQREPALRCRRLPLLELVGQLVEELRVTAVHRGIRLSAQLRSDVPAILADPMQLHPALSRVLSDAARATAPGGELYVGLSRVGKHAVVGIHSTGCGIDSALVSDERGFESARRCLELHGATLQHDAPANTSERRITISFPPATREVQASPRG